VFRSDLPPIRSPIPKSAVWAQLLKLLNVGAKVEVTVGRCVVRFALLKDPMSEREVADAAEFKPHTALALIDTLGESDTIKLLQIGCIEIVAIEVPGARPARLGAMRYATNSSVRKGDCCTPFS